MLILTALYFNWLTPFYYRFLVKVSWYSLLNLFKFSYLCAKHLCLGGYKDQMKGIISHLCRYVDKNFGKLFVSVSVTDFADHDSRP